MWHIRQNDDQFGDEIYELYPTLMSFKMHHGGFFTNGGGREYLNGKITYVDLIDTGSLSLHDLVSVTQELGYPDHEIVYYHFMRPDSDIRVGLQALRNEEDVCMLLKYFPKFKLIDVYTEHGFSNLDNYSQSVDEYDVEIQELPNENLLLGWHLDKIGEDSGLGQDGIDAGLDETQNSDDFDPFFSQGQDVGMDENMS